MILTRLPVRYYFDGVETIIFKVREGTKARLKRLRPNLSALLRDQVEKLISRPDSGNAYDKAAHLAGSLKRLPAEASTSKDYLRQYGQKNAR